MKIYAISDLHLEFYSDHKELLAVLKPILQEADVLLLAGDIGDPVMKGDSYKELLLAFKKMYKHVILVAGNHEYYKCYRNMELTRSSLKKICSESDVIFLDNQSVIIDNVKFVGTTLWSKGDISIRKRINDIGNVFDTVDEYNAEFNKCFEWLKKELEFSEEKTNETIIITHHLPTTKLRNARFDDCGALNTAFYTDILDQLNLKEVGLWVCGHTHESKVYFHPKFDNDTIKQKELETLAESEQSKGVVKFIVNPFGYPKEFRLTTPLIMTYNVA